MGPCIITYSCLTTWRPSPPAGEDDDGDQDQYDDDQHSGHRHSHYLPSVSLEELLILLR